jgi:hypothetical protein
MFGAMAGGPHRLKNVSLMITAKKNAPSLATWGKSTFSEGGGDNRCGLKKARLLAIVGVICCDAAELTDQNEKMFDLLAVVCASAQSPSGFGVLGYHLGRASACQATTY